MTTTADYVYECQGPGCRARIELTNQPKTQNVLYPTDYGPLAPAYKTHDCPAKRGLWPPEIDEHPLAKKIS